jgi:hypothetical protein
MKPPPVLGRLGAVLLLSAALLPLPGSVEAAPAEGTGAEPARLEPKSLDDLGRLITEAANRLDRLKEEAQRDPRERLVAEYLSYDTERMSKSRGRVTAEDLVSWMADDKPTTQFPFRESCARAVLRGAKMLQDVDLTQEKKRGGSTNRGYFMAKHVAPLLASDDRTSRSLALLVLRDLYGNMLSEEEIAAYNLDDKSTWRGAVGKWVRHLKKKG